MEDRIQRMKELVSILREAGKAYYQESREIMSNFEYDKLYDELVSLEKETGVTLSGSPSQQVGYEILSELPKETHGSHAFFGQDKEWRICRNGWETRRDCCPEDGWSYHCAHL